MQRNLSVYPSNSAGWSVIISRISRQWEHVASFWQTQEWKQFINEHIVEEGLSLLSAQDQISHLALYHSIQMHNSMHFKQATRSIYFWCTYLYHHTQRFSVDDFQIIKFNDMSWSSNQALSHIIISISKHVCWKALNLNILFYLA